MPEEYPDNNNANNDEIIDETDEKEDLENREHSKIQKMLHMVQNFFNNVPTKWIKDGKNKVAGQNNAVRSRNARNSPQKAVSSGKENEKTQRNARNSPHKGVSRYKENENTQRNTRNSPQRGVSRYKENENTQRNAGNSPQKGVSSCKENEKTQRNVSCRHRCCWMHQLKANEQLQQTINDPFENQQLDHDNFKEELESKASHKNKNTGDNDVEVEALLEVEKEMETSPNEPEKSIRVKARKENLKPGCSSSQSLAIPNKEIHRRHSEHTIRRISSSNDRTIIRPSSENVSLNLNRLSENNVRTEQMSHLRPGSVILLSETDMNVKLTEFKPDVCVSFHQLSKFESNPGLMSGGQIVFQDFADIFMIPDYYADDPIILDDSSNDIHINEQSSLKQPNVEIIVMENFFSGARVIDNSSKGLILPDLFPINPNTLNWSPNVSSDETSQSFSSGSDTSLDILSNTLAAREINSSNSDLDDVFANDPSDNDVATVSTDVIQNATEDKCIVHESTGYSL